MSNQPPRVLIVDDETNIRLMLRTALQTLQYEIHEAGNGREALDTVAKWSPDVMILDLSMPVLDGMGVLQELKPVRIERKPRIVVLTAYGSIPAAVRATRSGRDRLSRKAGLSRRGSRKRRIGPYGADAAGRHGALGRSALGRLRRRSHAGAKALRMAQYADAETLLMKAADLSHKDAPYYNLLGVLYEAQRQWRLAARFYNKAIAVNSRYDPAQRNLWRLQELKRAGKTREPAVLGDEPDVMFAKLPGEF